MLDFFTIITKGGLILWYIQNSQRDYLTFVNKLLVDVFVEERLTVQKYSHENIQMEYLVNNHLNVIYIAGYYRSFSLSYVKNLLDDADKAFEKKISELGESKIDFFKLKKMDFSNEYEIILKYRLKMDEFNTSNNINIISEKQSRNKENTNSLTSENEIVDLHATKLVKDDIENSNCHLRKIKNNGSKPKKISKPKLARVWDDLPTNNNLDNTSLLESLDFSKKNGEMDDHLLSSPIDKETIAIDKNELSKNLYESITSKKPTKKSYTNGEKSKFFDFFKGLVGSRQITKENLEPIMTTMKHHLCDKNVAADIADNICQSVIQKLIGVNLSTFEALKTTVKNAMIESIQKVLIPSNDYDLLADVERINSLYHRPYVVVMCGVNGVGKSTNLAKIAHHLMVNKNFRLMIAACDTFRSGAVEQLRTHVKRLNHIISTNNNISINSTDQWITLYDKGYNRDASIVAKEAIIQAKKLNKHAVLIDTAGRMQDNEPLMRSLSKLIHINSPDLVLFVGEALVGNDGVDQLKKFNDSLREYSCTDNPHLIDGIVLTKFDTIDDKVGAAISMTYTSGKPIMFVGIGQTYSDLKKFDVDSVVKLLFQ